MAQVETPKQKRERLRREYANSQVPLEVCNRVGREDNEKWRAKLNGVAQVAINAVTRALSDTGGGTGDKAKK